MTQAPGITVAALDDAVILFRNARRVTVLTGAGISTPSGIPDFRSEGTGLWSHDEPMEVASLSTFRTNPVRFFNWLRPLASQIFRAEPNAAHDAFAALENTGRSVTVITQNIDGLHQRAGSKQVIEMHGTLQTLSCTSCYKKHAVDQFIQPFVEHGALPLCPNCNGLLKPDVILFGEQLPQSAWHQAQSAARNAT